MMGEWLLITTIFIALPDRDFHGTIVHNYDNKIECEMHLDRSKELFMNFGPIDIDITSDCVPDGEKL